MPQKPVFSRSPLMTVPHSFPAAGTVRASDKRILSIYQKASRYIEKPYLWEGLFRLACLLVNKPINEPVAVRIMNAYADTDNGAFSGSFSEQICIARAALSLFEYNTDRSILARLSAWVRYTEIEYDRLIMHDGVLFKPADMMEFLVRYYQVSGSKTAVRLCAKLRSDAFDWTTSLHTFKQSIPIKQNNAQPRFDIPEIKPEDIDYEEKERIINHSELLADGVRYTLFAGLFSGHSMDISAGKTVWEYLVKYHHALCGGTTGNPYLNGNAADQIINNYAISAWAEALASQMILPDFRWAADELIRIIYNGLDDCLNNENISDIQRINMISDEKEPLTDPAYLYARLTRAVSLSYSHAVTLMKDGIRINYMLPGRFLLMPGGQTMLLNTDYEKALIQSKAPFSGSFEVFLPSSGTGSFKLVRKEETGETIYYDLPEHNGCCICTGAEWRDRDIIVFCPDEHVLCEKTHHQGAAFVYCNRLLCMPVQGNDYARAVCSEPVASSKQIAVMTVPTEKWKNSGEQPGDIPVLPEAAAASACTELIPYSLCSRRITMFPRTR